MYQNKFVTAHSIGTACKAVNHKPARIITTVLLMVFSLLSHADHLSGGFGISDSGPVMTETAVPLQSGKWAFGIRTEFINNDDFTDRELITLRGMGIDRDGEADEDLHNIGSILGVSLRASYGFTDNLTLGMRLPYVKRSDIREPEEGHAHAPNPVVVHNIIDHGNAAGWGDLTMFGLYRFYEVNNHQASLLLGLKAPTGDTNETGFVNEYFAFRYETQVVPDGHYDDDHHHDGTLLETHQQPGSGSWDGSLGLAYRYEGDKINFDMSLLYTITSEGSQDTDPGDAFSYNAALSHTSTQMVPCSSCSWGLILELNGEWRDRETRDGISVGNSGGNILYLSPGLRLNFGNTLNLSMSFGYAIVNDVNGDQSEPDYRVVGALGYRF